MTGMRRSVLALRLRDGVPEPWPPPDAEAVPDAVILSVGTSGQRAAGSEGAGTGFSTALASLSRWSVDCILDAPLADLERWVEPGVTSVLCSNGPAERIRDTDTLLAGVERTRGLPAGSFGIDLLLSAPGAFLQLDELLAASDRIVSAMADPAALPEAFRVEASVEVDQFAYPRGRLVLAAAHRGVRAVGLFAPAGHHAAVAEAAGMDAAQFSFASGLHGGLCHSWAEVRTCNLGFIPNEARVARARRIIEALEEAGRQGLGAVSLDGRMIDLPFIQASEATLWLASQAGARTAAVRAIFSGGG